jgi:hypothetical protein
MDEHPLDGLFGEMAEACRGYLLAWQGTGCRPSVCSDSAHDRLIDAHQRIEQLVDRIEAHFASS